MDIVDIVLQSVDKLVDIVVFVPKVDHHRGMHTDCKCLASPDSMDLGIVVLDMLRLSLN